jgi:CBS domain-containing protein
LNVGYIVTRPLVTIAPGKSVLEAAKVMVENNVGLLVVCDGKDKSKLAGVISERDIMKSIASGSDLSVPVEELSTRNVITVKASSDVAEAAKVMNKHRIRHVVVVDDKGGLLGVVSMRDLVGERATLASILQSNDKEVFVGGD